MVFKSATKPNLRDVFNTDRLRCQMCNVQSCIECSVEILPQVAHRIELKYVPRLNHANVVVVKKIEDDILFESGSDKTRQSDDEMSRKMGANKLFQPPPIESVWMQSFSVDSTLFGHSHRRFEHINCANQNKC